MEWTLFYIVYIITTVRFFLHSGVLAFPIPKQRFKRKESKRKILIQYPICNEPVEFVERFVKSLDSIPKEHRSRFLLQICDDSATSILPFLKSIQIPIKWSYARRWGTRTGKNFTKKNKACNLNHGLSLAPKKYEYVCIYDTDHVMDGVGLIDAAEILEAEPKTVCVQSRWVMNNLTNTFLSKLQEQLIFVHIEREQTFKSVYNLLPIFNGAGALIKRHVVEKECGGWLERAVCEDVDITGYLGVRGYNFKVLPTWITKIDNVKTWKEYRKQQSRWIKSNGQHIQNHGRDLVGWLNPKKWYFMSWNLGFLFGFLKYIIPFVMTYKYLHTGFNWLDWALSSPHVFAWTASCLTWDNKVKWKGLYLYPLHYILEHGALFTQIKAFWIGLIWYDTDFKFEVTDKGKLK